MKINGVVAGVILLLLGTVATVYGLTPFTQSFPGVPATLGVLTPNCLPLIAVPNVVAPGSSGGVSFGCGTLPAFTVTNDGVSTPSFTLPSGGPYTGVAIINSASAPSTGCTALSGSAITSNTSFSFIGASGKGNSYNYCVTYTNAPPSSGLPIFTISWTG